MTSFIEADHPRTAAGKFTGKPEAAEQLDALPPAGADTHAAVYADPRWREANTIAADLVSWRTGDGRGTFTETERQDDVEDKLREVFPDVPQADFDYHVAAIGTAAEHLTHIERCLDDPYDTDEYADLAETYNIDLEDCVTDDPGIDDDVYDYRMYAEKVADGAQAAMSQRLAALVRLQRYVESQHNPSAATVDLTRAAG